MISNERLEELIEQGATIYSNEYGEIQLIKENDLSLYENGQNNYILYVLEPNKKYHNEIFDKDLFETEEDAKWFAEFGCIERTERLELPTWEEINKCSLYTLYFNNPELYLYRVYFNRDAKTISIEEQSEEYLECFTQIEEWKLTKENYILACRKAKELFLGKKK